MRRIALIEGSRELSGEIVAELRGHGYRVDTYRRGREAEEALAEGSHDFVIIDHELPDVSGFTLCRELRAHDSTRRLPIMLLTKRSADDRITGFELGADECLGKPFSVRELGARVDALLRRFAPGDGRLECYEGSGLVVDFRTFTAELNGEVIALSSNEVEVLLVLIRHSPAVVSKEQVLLEVWPDEEHRRATTRTVDHLVRSLRKKIGPQRITLLIGRGFRFEQTPSGELVNFPGGRENGASSSLDSEEPRRH
jgi:DNA-binding response OmpR family regulator